MPISPCTQEQVISLATLFQHAPLLTAILDDTATLGRSPLAHESACFAEFKALALQHPMLEQNLRSLFEDARETLRLEVSDLAACSEFVVAQEETLIRLSQDYARHLYLTKFYESLATLDEDAPFPSTMLSFLAPHLNKADFNCFCPLSNTLMRQAVSIIGFEQQAFDYHNLSRLVQSSGCHPITGVPIETLRVKPASDVHKQMIDLFYVHQNNIAAMTSQFELTEEDAMALGDHDIARCVLAKAWQYDHELELSPVFLEKFPHCAAAAHRLDALFARLDTLVSEAVDLDVKVDSASAGSQPQDEPERCEGDVAEVSSESDCSESVSPYQPDFLDAASFAKLASCHDLEWMHKNILEAFAPAQHYAEDADHSIGLLHVLNAAHTPLFVKKYLLERADSELAMRVLLHKDLPSLLEQPSIAARFQHLCCAQQSLAILQMIKPHAEQAVVIKAFSQTVSGVEALIKVDFYQQDSDFLTLFKNLMDTMPLTEAMLRYFIPKLGRQLTPFLIEHCLHENTETFLQIFGHQSAQPFLNLPALSAAFLTAQMTAVLADFPGYLSIFKLETYRARILKNSRISDRAMYYRGQPFDIAQLRHDLAFLYYDAHVHISQRAHLTLASFEAELYEHEDLNKALRKAHKHSLASKPAKEDADAAPPPVNGRFVF